MKAQEQIDLIDHNIEMLSQARSEAFSEIEYAFYDQQIEALYKAKLELQRKVRRGHT